MNFNPRSYKRSDVIFQMIKGTNVISIHAPTRGATLQFPCPVFHHYYFNPRSYKRSDVTFKDVSPCAPLFQSTLLQEERLCGDPFLCTLRRFQSTLLQEERLMTEKSNDMESQFQSTLLQEERLFLQTM